MKVTLREPDTVNQQNRPKTTLKTQIFQVIQYPYNSLMERLAFMLIRPPRFIYNPDILNPTKKARNKFKIQTYEIPFELTIYRPQKMRYIILYLHGNGSSRFQGTIFLNSLPQKVGLACFDFAGCGNRQQTQYITLGYHQCKQVDIAATFLKKMGLRVIGWGRSMGAVSLLMSNQCDIMVADSAYSNLKQLCKQSSSKFLPPACCCIFNCLFPCVFACIDCKVQSLSGLEISEMNTKQRLKNLRESSNKKAICFIHGQDDTLINYRHSQQLYKSFEGRKMLLIIDGNHNSTRSQQVIQKCFQFIEEGLKKQETRVLSQHLIEMDDLNNKNYLGINKQSKQTKQSKNTMNLQQNLSFSIRQMSNRGQGRPTNINIPFQQISQPSKYERIEKQVQYNFSPQKQHDYSNLNKQQQNISFCKVINEDDYYKINESKMQVEESISKLKVIDENKGKNIFPSQE